MSELSQAAIDYKIERDRYTKLAAEIELRIEDGTTLDDACKQLADIGVSDEILRKTREIIEADIAEKSKLSAPLMARLNNSYYDRATKEYLMINERGQYLSLSTGQYRLYCKQAGLNAKAGKGDRISESDEHIIVLQQTRDVGYSGELAGYDSGLIEMYGERILVTRSPMVPEPKPGSWDTIRAIVYGLLGDDSDQPDVFLWWLKVGYEALRARKHRPGQAVVLAGPVGIGKSLLQKIVTVVLGGRCAKPYQYMVGETPFNADLFCAEHQMIEDEVPSTDIRARRHFGAQIKSLTVNTEQRCHAKGRTPVMLKPFWRATISLNDEPEAMQVLPPIDEDVADKLMLLQCYPFDFPMPTDTQEDYDALYARIQAEVPAMCHDLTRMTISQAYVSKRFGVQHYHHPDLLYAIDRLAPEVQLWELIEHELLLTDEEWSGGAAELVSALTKGESTVAHTARSLLRSPQSCGAYLSRLAKRMPGCAIFNRTGANGREWTLRRAKLV